MEILLSIITGLLSSSKAIELGVSLINRIIDKIDANKELKKQWAKIVRELDKKVSIRLSSETTAILAIIEEEERLDVERKKMLSEQVLNYQENNKKLYSENLALKDKVIKADNYFKGEF